MFTCPRCRSSLRLARPAGSLAWACPRCEGRALLTVTLQRRSGERIRAATNALPASDALECPSCRAPMCTSDIQAGEDRVGLDVCRPCALVWFDGGEHDIVRDPFPRAPRPPPIPLRATTRTLGDMKLGHVRDAPVVTSLPIATWCLIAIVLLVSVSAFLYSPDWLQHRAFADEAALPVRGRNVIFVVVARCFLHANVVSLLFQLATLAIVGPIVEERFERRGFALLFVGTGLGVWIASSIAGAGGTLYAVGLGPFLAAAWTAVLMMHPRARLQLWPRPRFDAPVWICAAAWGVCESGAALAGIVPPIWPALLAGVIVGALSTALSGLIDDALPVRSPF